MTKTNIQFLVRSTTEIADSNVFDKTNKKCDTYTVYYQIRFSKEPKSETKAGDDNSVLKEPKSETKAGDDNSVLKEILESNLKRIQLPNTLENRFKATHNDLTSAKQAFNNKEYVPLDEVTKSLNALEKKITTANNLNDDILLKDFLNQLKAYMQSKQIRFEKIESLKGDKEFLKGLLLLPSLKKISHGINNNYVVDGLRNIITTNIVLKKSLLEFFIVKTDNDTISELDLIPDKTITVRQKPSESFGKSPESFYLKNGFLELRASLNNGEAKEKRILLPMPPISENIVGYYPDDFEKAAIKGVYNPETYDFLLKPYNYLLPSAENEPKTECVITPVYLYEGMFYSATEVFLESYQSKPKTKASTTKIMFSKKDHIANEKKKAVKALRAADGNDSEGGGDD